ncbi:MAG: hypothetical protein ACK4SZ_05095 [Allosphingosinicella sp.]|uniref:COG3904 family protein n=1 Tax=Allosphingosinicella sp. TaxID=2823234 RepID=UPI0039611BF1
MRKLALLIALTALPAAASAEPGDCLPGTVPVAADASRQPMRFFVEDRGATRILHAEGTIEVGDAARLAPLLAADPDEIWFDSPGGDMREALLIGRTLRARRAFTRIPAGARCVGACAEAFLGGVAREVDEGGRLGFTAVPLSDPSSAQTQAERENAAARWAEERADYYIRAGISRGLLRLQLDTPAPGICWLSEAGLRRYNVTNLPSAEPAAGD